jgi:hypothetical protein
LGEKEGRENGEFGRKMLQLLNSRFKSGQDPGFKIQGGSRFQIQDSGRLKIHGQPSLKMHGAFFPAIPAFSMIIVVFATLDLQSQKVGLSFAFGQMPNV